ncbi:MAG: hypothetical protein ACM3VZ_14610 [Acidobacteriota bacterium]
MALLIWQVRSDAGSATEPVASQGAAPATPQLASAPSAPTEAFGDKARQARRDKLKLLQAQLAEAQQRLDSYKAATRYPHDSRPLSEHQDQIKPFAPITEDKPMRTQKGEAIPGQHLRTTQDRVFVSGQESVLLTVSLVDDNNRALPLRVSRAVAHETQGGANINAYPPVALQFEDRGTNGDAVAGDQTLSVRFQPATQGFATLAGTIRIEVYLQGDAGPGQTFFDIVYSPVVPAVWLGGAHEMMEGGSLAFYLKANVKEAGRYVISARAYDANGKPFALLTFNDEVAAGAKEFRLPLFGRLVRDLKPAFPITLRDVEGFLLYENRFPDRAMMPRWPGVMHTSANYPLSSFSDAEWTSEERSRYLNEYSKDVNQAQTGINELEKAQP